MIAMLPFGGQNNNHVRVPPIYYDTNKELLTSSTSTTPMSTNLNSRLNANNLTRNSNLRLLNGTSRRGRRSNVPPELREQTRRLKKQNMERRRRACISDKMNALHNLAMNLIGANPHECQKVEKADILSLCYKVFEGIATIANEEPELRERLKQLRNSVPQTTPMKVSTSTPIHSAKSKTTDRISENTNLPTNSTPITIITTTTTNSTNIPTCNYADNCSNSSTIPINHKKYLHKKMYKSLKFKLNKSNLPDSGFDQSSFNTVLPVLATNTTATALSSSSFLLGQASFENDKENQSPQQYYPNHMITPLEMKKSVKTENYSTLNNNNSNLLQDSGFISPNSWNSHNISSQYLNTTPISTCNLVDRSMNNTSNPYSIPTSTIKDVTTNSVLNRIESSTPLCNRINQINNFTTNEHVSAFKKCNKNDQYSSKNHNSLSVWRPYLD